jgi:hypothetical protein
MELAAGKPLIFKLHPNDDIPRARCENEEITPGSMIFTQGDIKLMIVNYDS